MTMLTDGVASWSKALVTYQDTVVCQRWFWLEPFLVLRVLPRKVVCVHAGVYAGIMGMDPYPSWRWTSEGVEQLGYY